MARTLVQNPDIILFDEPMSALMPRRGSVEKGVKGYSGGVSTTMIYNL
ncbi:MAG: hypothetical protein ACLVKR_08280 [Lachnospiraceae bacterium]